MSATKEAPRLPDVVDEAGATPRWVPLLGIALLLAAVVLLAAMRLLGGGEGEEAAPPPDEAAAQPEGEP